MTLYYVTCNLPVLFSLLQSVSYLPPALTIFGEDRFHSLAENTALPSSPQSNIDLILSYRTWYVVFGRKHVSLNVTTYCGGSAPLRNNTTFHDPRHERVPHLTFQTHTVYTTHSVEFLESALYSVIATLWRVQKDCAKIKKWPCGYVYLYSILTCYMPRLSHSPRFDHPSDIGEQYRSLSSSLCSFLHSRYLFPHRPKYSPQHPILEYLQHTFLPQFERPSFAHIQNNRQNYISVYLNLCIFENKTGRQKILHRMTASITWLQSALNFVLNRFLNC